MVPQLSLSAPRRGEPDTPLASSGLGRKSRGGSFARVTYPLAFHIWDVPSMEQCFSFSCKITGIKSDEGAPIKRDMWDMCAR